ncbi:MAG: indole-3-glycerol phosphate synthase TrpC [Clostridiales bacterium]|jgi:indole-3-glycerol phosphate synthase|nr:indole-3-glycerol phosphate synthase TrpC [Clostridiales bacterium]
MILDQIVTKRNEQLAREEAQISLNDIKNLALHDKRSCICLYDALKQPSLSVIAEVKKASPSKGLICENFDPVAIAKEYEAAGANAISVLTEEHYFQGSSDYLKAIRQEVALPLLRKDFIINPYQIYEAKVLGADAILLIAALLDSETMEKFKNIAYGLGLSCLAEVHNREELDRVLESDFRIIGINNRNLKTFDVSLNTTEQLASYIPEQCIVVAESGIATSDDMRTVHANGADAVLIGETLMRSGNISETLKNLRKLV